MYLIQLGHRIRDLRKASGLTQAQLAQLAGLARETLSRIEGGTYNDVGVKKLITLLGLVGGELSVVAKPKERHADFVERALSAANISHKYRLHADELIQALVTGTIPPGKAGHLQAVFEDLSPENREALIQQVETLTDRAAKVRSGAERLRARLALRA